ncbi:MAG: capsular polysaccharide biosynthesis protein [Ruminococcus sp.]|nr:capsular polysaccharide biosynthesis protein [Ruminococcus sp.]
MRTDYHCHVLPEIDDGAKNTDMSVQMLEMLHGQGVERVTATPHFYAHREKSVRRFLEKRQQSYDKLMSCKNPFGELILGAEVAVEHGISELEGIERLAISGTDLILLEFPYGPYAEWMSEEIYNISCEYHLTPVIAHIHRYIGYYSRSEMEHILKTNAVFQINNEAFGSFREKRFVKALMKSGVPVVFGSDSHNMSGRRPNFDLLAKKAPQECIEASDMMLDKYLKK